MAFSPPGPATFSHRCMRFLHTFSKLERHGPFFIFFYFGYLPRHHLVSYHICIIRLPSRPTHVHYPPHLRHKEEKEEEKQIKSKSKKALSNYLISWKPSYIRNYVSCLPNSPRDEEMRIAFSHRHLTHFLIDINFNPLILTPSLLEQIH